MAFTVYRVYLSGSNWVQGSALSVKDVKVTKRVNQAGTASFKVPGSTLGLNLNDRVWITDGTYTWGGMVYSINRTKGGFDVQCVDYLYCLTRLAINDEFWYSTTDHAILDNVLSRLTLPKSPTRYSTSAEVSIPYFKFSGNAFQLLQRLAMMTGKQFYSYQGGYNITPSIVYTTLSGGSSGLSFSASQILDDWSEEKSRDKVANFIRINCDIMDVPVENDLCKLQSGVNLIAGSSLISGDLYRFTDETHQYHYGFKFNAPYGLKNPIAYFTVRRWGNPTNFFYINLYNITTSQWFQKTTSNYYGGGGVGETYIFYAQFNQTLPAGVYWFEIEDYNPYSATDYWEIPADNRLSITDVGGSETVRLNVYHFWLQTPTTLYTTLPFWIREFGNNDKWISDDGNYYIHQLGLLPGGDYLNMSDLGAGSIPGWSSIYAPLFTELSSADYDYLEIEIIGDEELQTDIGWDYKGFRVALKDASGNYVYTYCSGLNKTHRLYLGANKSFTLQAGSSTFDWTRIVSVHLRIPVRWARIKRVQFISEKYTKEVSDATSISSYGELFLEENVDFLKRSQVDDYATNLLNLKKQENSAISVRVLGTHNITPYKTVSLTYGGQTITPKVLGHTWDGYTTKLILDDYPVSKLPEILSKLGK